MAELLAAAESFSDVASEASLPSDDSDSDSGGAPASDMWRRRYDDDDDDGGAPAEYATSERRSVGDSAFRSIPHAIAARHDGDAESVALARRLRLEEMRAEAVRAGADTETVALARRLHAEDAARAEAARADAESIALARRLQADDAARANAAESIAHARRLRAEHTARAEAARAADAEDPSIALARRLSLRSHPRAEISEDDELDDEDAARLALALALSESTGARPLDAAASPTGRALEVSSATRPGGGGLERNRIS